MSVKVKVWDLHGLDVLNLSFPFFIHHYGHASIGRSERGALTIEIITLCCSLPEIAGDVRLQVIVRRAAAVATNGARNGTRMVMRSTGTCCLTAGASAVGHIVIS